MLKITHLPIIDIFQLTLKSRNHQTHVIIVTIGIFQYILLQYLKFINYLNVYALYQWY